jgi:lysophospholipase L1-like esterase
MDAGAPIGPCFRYNDSYPAQLNRTARLGSDHEFQFAACGGAFMNGMAGQINFISKPDFATISIGGNDAGFFKTLDACVYKFYSSFTSTCYEKLDEATDFIKSEYFENKYGQIIDDLLRKNDAPSYRVFATGYSPFFDHHMTDDCNDQSLSYWPFYQAKLTVDVRTRLNEVVDRLNEKMGQIIKDRQDNRIIFVNWAHRFDQHRFCQPGKPPEDGENTWFFNAGRRDPFITTGRVFHPKPQGYSAIVDEILSVWEVAPAVK